MPDYKSQRQKMVQNQLKKRDITDKKVLEAMSKVPREKFVPDKHIEFAYQDTALPIGNGQTISQPYIVAKMCQLLELKGAEKVLDIGTGSGYEAAVLSHLADQVVTIEIVKKLAKKAKKLLKNLGYNNVKVIIGNGAKGAPSEAPFDAIKSAAAATNIPEAWKEQLKPNGRIVFPEKQYLGQNLIRAKKVGESLQKEQHGSVLFVPLVYSEE